MKLEANLEVSANDFFKIITDSAQEELNVFADGKTLVQGVEYEKELKTKLSTAVSTKVKITKLIKNKEYEYCVISGDDKNFVNYKIEEIDSDNIKIYYSEFYKSESKKKEVNNKSMTFIMKYFLNRRFQKQMKMIENHIKGE